MYHFSKLRSRLKINQYCQNKKIKNLFTNLKQFYSDDLKAKKETPTRKMSEVKRLVIHTDVVYVDGKVKHKSEGKVNYVPKKEELPPRSMQDSLNIGVLDLSQDTLLQNRYVAVGNHVRRGRLLEDLDIFAVWTCMQHVHIPKLDPSLPLPYVFVTVSVQEIDFTEYKALCYRDIYLRGHVSWVGTTSMEVIASIEQVDAEEKSHRITKAIFLIAARNLKNDGSLPVNPLVPESEVEKKIYAEALVRKIHRQEMANKSLLQEIPHQVEQKILHDLFRLTVPKGSPDFGFRILPKDSVWMSKSIVSTTIATHPDHKNAQNTIFGGFLLRITLELSWTCAYLYCKKRPTLLKICDVSFQRPVTVFSLLNISATVVYTHNEFLTIMAIIKNADTKDEGISDVLTTNVFYCILKSYKNVPQSLPSAYHENLWYLEGRREFCHAMKIDCEK